MRIKAKMNFRALITDGRDHEAIDPGAEYFVLGVEDDYYRLAGSDGEAALYPKELFEVLDCTVPAGWQFYECEDGEYFLAPVRTAPSGFYEDWHGSDGDLVAQASNRQILHDELVRMAAESDSAEDKRLIRETLLRLRMGNSH